MWGPRVCVNIKPNIFNVFVQSPRKVQRKLLNIILPSRMHFFSLMYNSVGLEPFVKPHCVGFFQSVIVSLLTNIFQWCLFLNDFTHGQYTLIRSDTICQSASIIFWCVELWNVRHVNAKPMVWDGVVGYGLSVRIWIFYLNFNKAFLINCSWSIGCRLGTCCRKTCFTCSRLNSSFASFFK